MKTESNEIHYTRSVIELSEILPVITSQAVFSTTGIKLVSEGVRLNASFFERLAQHNMAPPLEQCLVVEGGVDHAHLEEEAQRLLHENTRLAAMAKNLPDTGSFWPVVTAIPISDPIQFLLTLAKERRPALFRHSLVTMLIALYLGMRQGMGHKQLVELATSALLHDIGELRLDDQLFDSHAPLDAEGRRQIYLHPVIGQVILASSPEYSQEVIHAVLQHHERMDGSGYPNGLAAEQITRLAQYVALAEVAASKVGSQPARGASLEVILKLNAAQFAADLVGYLGVLSQKNQTVEPQVMQQIQMRLGKIGEVLAQWKTLSANLLIKNKSAAGLVQRRLEDLEISLLDAGVNPADMDGTTGGIEQDAAALKELDQLCLETLWQLRAIVLETRRSWPEYATDTSPAGQAVYAWLSIAEPLLQA